MRGVTNRIGTGSHDKIAIVFKYDEGAIVFNDFPNPGPGAALRLAGGVTLSSAQLLAMAQANAVASGAALSPTLAEPVTSTAPGVDRAGTNGNEWLLGSLGNDRLSGNEGINLLEALGGDDQLFGGNNRDIMLGGDGNDQLYGNQGDDLLIGGAGNDLLHGTGGADVIYGDEEDEAVIHVGGAGNSLFVIAQSSDEIQEAKGGGHDTAQVSATSFALGTYAEVEVLQSTVTSAAEDVLLVGSNTNNLIIGHIGRDTLSGLGGNDVIKGGAGNDDLDGGAGNDSLSGGAGQDRLVGGLGRDILKGDTGADMFDFNAIAETKTGAARDVVYFSQAQGDKIDLSTIDAKTADAADQAFTWIGSRAFTSGSAGQLRLSDGVMQGDVDGDGKADFEIRIVGVFGAGDLIL